MYVSIITRVFRAQTQVVSKLLLVLLMHERDKQTDTSWRHWLRLRSSAQQNWRLSTNVWSITAGGTVPSIHARYVADCVDRRRVWYANAALRSSGSSVCHRWWYKSAKKMHHIFAYNRLPWGASAPRVTFLEIPHRADVNIWLTCNAATYLSRYSLLEGQHFGFWESPGGTAPKRGADTSGTHMYHHAKLMQKCKTFMYSYCITVVCPRLLTVGDSVVFLFFYLFLSF